MSDLFDSSIEANYGVTHLGGGNQYVNQHFSFTQLAQAVGKDPRHIADDQLAWLRKRFVHPGGFNRARLILEHHGTVFLDGAPGSGRKSTAWMLLKEWYSGNETFCEILPDEGGERRRLETDQVGDDTLILMDLSAFTGERIWSKVRDELHDLRAAVRRHTARLAVVLPAGTSERLPMGLGAFRVEITRPPDLAVFQRYLRAADIPVAETAPVPAPLSDFFARTPSMRGISDLAELVVEARARSEGGFATWCQEALKVLDNQQSTGVVKKLATLLEGPQRALLLTTAMLHGARAEVIHHASAALLREAGHPQADIPLLEQKDLAVRLKEIDATTDVSGQVRFDEFGYDSAIRTHFWTHWPELREPVQRWIAAVADLHALERGDRDELVKRFAERCLHDGHPNLLLSLAWRCAETAGNRLRLEASVQALRRGLEDEAHGRFFRQKIREWASDSSVSHGLAQVLVVTCWKVIAVHHPDQAMVRLHHLARREIGTAYARDALTGMVNSDVRLRVWMLKRLVQRLQPESAKWRRFDADLFLDFSDPLPLTTSGPHTRSPLSDPVVRERLAAGWHLVFRLRPYETWHARAKGWLHRAHVDDRHREHLVDVLIAGGGRCPDLLASLLGISREPAPLPEDGRGHRFIVDVVWRKIRTALGLQAV